MTSEVLSTSVVAYIRKNELESSSDFDDAALNKVIQSTVQAVSKVILLSPSEGFSEKITNELLQDINLKLSRDNISLLRAELNERWLEFEFDALIAGLNAHKHVPGMHVELLKKGVSSITWGGFTENDMKLILLSVDSKTPSDEKAKEMAEGCNADFQRMGLLEKK